jgi:trigger factor
MKVTQEKRPASQVSLTIEVPADLSSQVYENAIRKYAKTARIPGFRKGKVPRQVLLQQIGPQALKLAALDELLSVGVNEAIKQEKLEPVGQATMETPEEELAKSYEPGQPITFSVLLDVFPEVTLPTYEGLTVQAEEIQPDPNRLDNLLEQQRIESATLIPVEGRAAKLGDVAIVDYQGKLLPEEDIDPAADAELDLSGLEAKDFQVDLDPTKFVPGFAEGIDGMTVGETKVATVQFPEDYPREELAGRRVEFTITLQDLKERELPEVTDEFVQSISQFETLAALREALTEQFTKEAEQRTEDNKAEAVLQAILEQFEVELPESLIEQEQRTIVNQALYQLQQQGLDISQFVTAEMVESMKARSRPEAIQEVKTELLLSEIAKAVDVQVDPQDVREKTQATLAMVDRRKVDRRKLEKVIEADLYKERTIQWLVEHSTFELVPEGTLTSQDDSPNETPAEPAAEATIEVQAAAVPDDTEASGTDQPTAAESAKAPKKESNRKSRPSDEE